MLQKKNSSKSPKVYGWIIVAIIAIALALRVLHYFNDTPKSYQPWSEGYTNPIYQKIYNDLGSSVTDTNARKQFAYCVLEKLKMKYPKGINDINTDTLYAFNTISEKDCIEKVYVHFNWSEHTDSAITAGIMKAPWTKRIPVDKRKPLCECYISKIKQLYPNGADDRIPKAVKDSLILACAKSILN